MIEAGRSLRIGLPLLGGVVLEEGLEEGATNQGDTLIVQVLRVGTSQLTSLLSDERLCLCGRVSCVEELVDGTQVNRAWGTRCRCGGCIRGARSW